MAKLWSHVIHTHIHNYQMANEPNFKIAEIVLGNHKYSFETDIAWRYRWSVFHGYLLWVMKHSKFNHNQHSLNLDFIVYWLLATCGTLHSIPCFLFVVLLFSIQKHIFGVKSSSNKLCAVRRLQSKNSNKEKSFFYDAEKWSFL